MLVAPIERSRVVGGLTIEYPSSLTSGRARSTAMNEFGTAKAYKTPVRKGVLKPVTNQATTPPGGVADAAGDCVASSALDDRVPVACGDVRGAAGAPDRRQPEPHEVVYGTVMRGLCGFTSYLRA